jgi:hypothetical protein
MKTKKNSPNQMTKHHIEPRSRRYMGITGVCKVPRLMHELYHHLFGNMKPDEILQYLNEEFWNNMFEITIKKKPP